MNSLRRDIEKNESVIWNDKEVKVFGGFGMKRDTIGSALFVTLSGGENIRINSMDIKEVI